MPDTELTVAQPMVVAVPIEGLDFNGLVTAAGVFQFSRAP